MTDRLLQAFLEEARPGPWRPEKHVEPFEDEWRVWLTNDAGDSLLVDADDVARLVNAAIAEDAA